MSRWNSDVAVYRSRERAWIRELQLGDVVQSGSGMFRVVRSVRTCWPTRYCSRTWITFTIQACSWTKRCYTVMCCNDLITLGYKKVRARVSLSSKFAKAVARQIGRDIHETEMHCCDVRGIA